MQKIPYGEANFERISTQNLFFVDKTQYLEVLENLGEERIFFFRPRRFGKSLFCSILMHYYDCALKDRFQELFGKYYIGQNPTPLANQFGILFFSFSAIDTATRESTQRDFFDEIKLGIQSFLTIYGKNLPSERVTEVLSKKSANSMLKGLTKLHKDYSLPPIYLIIDEYDQFTNELLAFDFAYFKDIVSKNGYVRKFYEAIKEACLAGA
ncbi:MAG: AAA family ATPase, partial [Bacteroidia bacterium]|nr:AAA family ATPase [Bacteroidia bacterium]